jgi:hypothetical protein
LVSKFFSLLGYLIATSAEDPALIRYVCKRASATEANAKEATKALRREFKYVLADFSRPYFKLSLTSEMAMPYGSSRPQGYPVCLARLVCI